MISTNSKVKFLTKLTKRNREFFEAEKSEIRDKNIKITDDFLINYHILIFFQQLKQFSNGWDHLVMASIQFTPKKLLH